MLSVIVYGRNDMHGYNLHKRAAISLNCIAEVLDRDGDEIIFVDYNTPDDLPTFPEAIRDTLTPKARRLMRVIRVRQRHHEPLRTLTHLVAIEPVARNVAIRRSNPANRWILSTNPDMVLLPRAPHASLSGICAGLPDGSWHLPRFELPETFWESFDRMDAQGILARLGTAGRAYHLNEVVYGTREAIFDGHGDFQLMLRDDLHAIHGFDERMINGWHVDSNMAKRMALYRGDNLSLLPYCFGYHCDHTRLASIGHGRDRVENNLRRFFDEVVEPGIPEQADSWGLAGVELEEIRVDGDGATAYAECLGSTIAPMAEDYTEASFFTAYADLSYPPEHVVPYLADLLMTLPRDLVPVWYGARPSMLTLFAQVWQALRFTSPILVPQSCAAVAADLALPVAVVPDEQANRQGGLFFFEFGAVTQDLPAKDHAWPAGWRPEDQERLALVRRGFLAFVAAERQAIGCGAPPRRVVTVNAHSTRYQPMVEHAINANRTPYSSRLRQGFVIAEPDQMERTPWTPIQLGAWLTQRMGRRERVPIIESVRLQTAFEQFLACPHEDDDRLWMHYRAAGPLLEVLDYPRLTAQHAPEVLETLRRRLHERRPSSRWAGSLALPLADGPGPSSAQAPCRLAASEDWDEAGFADLAQHYFTGPFATSTFRRDHDLWWYLHVLNRFRAWGMGENARVLVVADMPTAFYDILTDVVGQVDVLDLNGRVAAARPNLFRDPARLTLVDRTVLDADAIYDAVVFCRDACFRGHGLNRGSALMMQAARRLRPDGVLALVERVPLDRAPASDEYAHDLGFASGVAGAWRRVCGLERLPAAPPVITRNTLDAMARDAKDTCNHHFVAHTPDGLLATGAWFFRKVDAVAADDALDALMMAYEAARG